MKSLLVVCFLFIGSLYAQVPGVFMTEVNSVSDYETYKGKPLSNKFGQVSALKVVYAVRDKKLYYIESVKYPFHIDFCTDYLDYYKGSFTFNYDNYTKTNSREYYLATINHYEAQNLYTLEFSVADQIRMDQIEELYDRITETFHITDTLRLFLNTLGLEERYAKSASSLPVISVDEIYGSQKYQAIKPGITYGRLRYFKAGESDPDDLWPDDVVILEGTPNDLPLVSGVIANTFQTPLSHISILCQNRGTPFMAYKEILDDTTARRLEGNLVRLEVTVEDFSLTLANPDSAKYYLESRIRTGKEYDLKLDTSVRELVKLEDLNHRKINMVGAKAANFGELNKALNRKGTNAKVPESAFAVPVWFYLKHVQRSGAKQYIDELVVTPETDREKQQRLLKKIRDIIRSYPVDTELLEAIDKEVTELGDYRRMRFRSSTNAEDIEGFNGAGLYTSATGIVGDTSKPVADAVRKVWASVWSDRAFFERQYFGMNQAFVAMGILVHRSFPDEKANGVIITKNIYRPEYLGIVINVQTGEIPVVNPPDSVICDQLICYSDAENTFYDPKRIIEYVSRSSEVEHTVMSDDEIIRLSREIARVEKHFYRRIDANWTKYSYEQFGLDLEFKIDGPDRQLYIKQVRPYRY